MPTDQPQALKKTEAGTKTTKDIEVLEGKINPHILLIAPHGVAGDDDNTGDLARSIQEILDCSAIINEVYRKPKKISKNPVGNEKHGVEQQILNLNRKSQAELHPTYIEEIKGIITEPAQTTVFWIHGIDDVNLTKECMVMIGHGQPDSLTCDKDTIDALANALELSGVNGVPTRNTAGNYRGHDPDNMNQWFKKSDNGYDAVQSIQLEFGYVGFRDAESIENTARAFSNALLGLNGISDRFSIVENNVDETIVDRAYEHLKETFRKHFHNAMVDAGRYIIDNFYAGDAKRVIENRPVRDKSLNQLVKELKQSNGNAPSRGWFYNSVDLAAHEIICEKEGFQTFGQLGHSHKLELLHVPKFGKIDKPTIDDKISYAFKEKERLAKIAIDKDKMLSVREFRAQIKKEFSSDGIDLKNVPPRKELREYNADVLRKSWTLARSRVEKCQKDINSYSKAIDKIGFVLTEKGNGLSGRKGKHQDWTDSKNNVNFCTGCENNCLYCYSRKLGYDHGWAEKGQWHQMKIRQDDVDKKRNLRDGLVGFPTSHDILPSNIDAYLIVLGKLLRAGNEVLIVSKPRFECIKRICDASQFFKDKILFRFTIGAMDDEILSFWEPNAPNYQERKKCLEYAFKNGFRTSVSMEPMLDTPNIKALINDLYSLVSEDIWLGIMKDLNRIEEDADDRLKQKIGIIKDGQRWYMLAPIYITYKDDPKIKWKTDAWRFSDWEKVKIQTECGTEMEATAPLIISGSRRTDIPGLHSDWFIERLRQGYLVIEHPRNRKITEHISFSKTRLIVFWTKNPEPMIKYLDEIKDMGIGCYFQYTLNNYEKERLEPNVPPLKERIDIFRTLSEKIGKEKVIWRFDPLILTDSISKDDLLDKVYGVMSQLTGYTEKLVISFCDYYKKTVRKLKHARVKYRDFSEDDINYLAQKLGGMGKELGVEIATCAEEYDLSSLGIVRNKCIDDDLIRRVFGKDDVLMNFIGDGTGLKDPSQRKSCGCIVSEEIGKYNTCSHNCEYCYANNSATAVKNNLERISQSSEKHLPN